MFTVNGEPVRLTLDPRESLLDVLPERLGLKGTKKGCDQGQCAPRGPRSDGSATRTERPGSGAL